MAIDIANKYTHKFKTHFIDQVVNKGVGEARNAGIDNSNGKYIFFIDSDDEIEVNTISLMVKVLTKYPDIELVRGLHRTIGFDGRIIESFDSFGWGTYLNLNCTKMILHGELGPVVWNTLIRKDVIVKNNIYFESIFSEDTLYVHYLSKYINKMFIINEETYVYYLNYNSAVNSEMSYAKLFSKYRGVNVMIQGISIDLSHRKLELEDIVARTFGLLSKSYNSFPENRENFLKLSKTVKSLNVSYASIDFKYKLYLPVLYLPFKLAVIYYKMLSTISHYRIFQTPTKKRIHK